MNKLTYYDISIVADQLAAKSYQRIGSYARVLGQYESMMCHMMADMPKAKQAEWMKVLEYNLAKEIEMQEPVAA